MRKIFLEFDITQIDLLTTIAGQLAREYPNENAGRNVTVVPLAQATINPGFRGNIVMAGGLLMTIVMLVFTYQAFQSRKWRL